jgi:hypothetical protein
MYTRFTHQYKGAVCIHFFGQLCININIKETGCNNVDWIYLAQDTDQQRVLVNMIMNIRIFRAELKHHYHEISWLNF